MSLEKPYNHSFRVEKFAHPRVAAVSTQPRQLSRRPSLARRLSDASEAFAAYAFPSASEARRPFVSTETGGVAFHDTAKKTIAETMTHEPMLASVDDC